MKTTKQTLNQIKAREEALLNGANPYDLIDVEDKIGAKKAKTYVTEFKGYSYIVDEGKNIALNSMTGEELGLETFLYMLRKEQSKDTTFSGNAEVLTSEELTPIIAEIQKLDYIKEDVARDTESKDGSLISRTFTSIYFEDKLLVIEQTATVQGADLLHFREPQIKLYNELSNAHLYYTDEPKEILNFLDFEMLDNYTYYNSEKEIIAHIGEYNFFKKAKGKRAVNTSKAKVNDLLNML